MSRKSKRTSGDVRVDIVNLQSRRIEVLTALEDVRDQREGFEASYRAALLARAQGDAAAADRATAVNEQLQATFVAEREALLTIDAIDEQLTTLTVEQQQLERAEALEALDAQQRRGLPIATELDAHLKAMEPLLERLAAEMPSAASTRPYAWCLESVCGFLYTWIMNRDPRMAHHLSDLRHHYISDHRAPRSFAHFVERGHVRAVRATTEGFAVKEVTIDELQSETV